MAGIQDSTSSRSESCDGKHPDGVTLLPWAKGKPWDVTIPDTYADCHLANTATTAGAAADKAAGNKEAKYRQLANSHIFVPVAIESAGTWNHQAVELVQKLGRFISQDLKFMKLAKSAEKVVKSPEFCWFFPEKPSS